MLFRSHGPASERSTRGKSGIRRDQETIELESPRGTARCIHSLAAWPSWTALLNNKEAAISEAKRATEILPVSKDALDGPGVLKNLAVVYAWSGELDLAFETLGPLTEVPYGIFYGDLKRDPRWEPLRQDPRYDKLLAELAPRD